MRSLLSASLVLMLAATASAQFGKNPPVADKPADPPKAADPVAGLPADPAAGGAPAAAGAASALFTALDLDGDGVISKVEIKKAIVSLKKLDADNNGSITLAECGGGAAAAGPAGVAANDPAAQWMDRIMAKDKNNDGKLIPNELTENERQMLQGADQNRDGAIDRQELGAMSNANLGLGAPGIGPGIGLGTAAGLSANGGQGNQVMGRFFQLDLNHDGRLSPDEVPPQVAGMLRSGDLNRDGAIDAAEMQALYAKMGDRMKGLNAGVDPAAGKAGTPGNEKNDRNKRQKNQN